MLQWWNEICLGVGDFLFGWTLALPSDLTLLIVAIVSAAVLTVVRLFTTNQDLLRRVAADKKRLKQLIREARQEGDKEAVRRYRRTFSMLGMTTMKAEGKPLLVAILPIAVLATWCLFRLGYHPPTSGEPVELAVYTPISDSGDVAHIVPQDGVEADGWVQRIVPVADEESLPEGFEQPWEVAPPYGLARWKITAPGRPASYRLVVRLGDAELKRELLVGQRTYPDPMVYHGDGIASSLGMEPLKLFGFVGGIRWLWFPPWLVAYLLIAIPFVPLLKRALRVH